MERSTQLQRVADGAGSLLSYADLVLQHTSGERREALLHTVRQQMLDYARLQAEVQQAALALQEVKDEVVSAISSGEHTDLDRLAGRVRERTEQKMATIGDLTAYDRYQELMRREEAAGSAAPAGDEELLMTDTHVFTLDPWTKQEIQQPFRNSRCGHVYDRSSLESILRKKSRRPTCPYVGCPNQVPLSWDDLTEDIVAKRAVEKRKTQSEGM